MAVFTIQLEDKTSGPAETATAAVRGLSAEFEALQKQMAAGASLSAQFDAYQKQLNDISAAQQGNLAHHDKNAYKAPETDKLLDDIKKQQQANLAKADAERDAAEGLRKQQEAAAETSKWFEELTGSADNASEQFAAFADTTLGYVVPAAEAAVAVITTYGKVLWDAARMAIALTQEKDQLESVFDVFTGGGGGELLDELEDLSQQLPFVADRVNAWGKSMIAAVGSGEKLKTAVRAVASAQAIMGEAGASAAQSLIKRFAMMAEAGQKVTLDRRILMQLGEAGVSVQALAKELGTTPDKLGKMQLSAEELGAAMQRALVAQGEGPLKRLGNTWDVISAKVAEGFEDAFEDLDDLVGPFMVELQSLASEFFAGGVAANDWKDVVRSALKVAFDVATNFLNWIHKGFLTAQIAMLEFRIAIKPVTDALGQLNAGGAVTWVVLYLLKGTVIVLAVVFSILALAVLAVASPFIILGIAIYFIIQAISYIIDVISGAIDNFDNLKAAASAAGAGIITGLGNAIMSGAAWVVGLMSSLASSMIGAITGPLKIKSPSRVMARMGQYVTEGLAGGIEQGTPAVIDASQGAGMATIAGAADGATGTGATAKGGQVTINIESGAVQINGGSASMLEQIEAALVAILERAAQQAGIAPAGARA